MDAEQIHRKLVVKKLSEGEVEPPKRRPLRDVWFERMCDWCSKEFDHRKAGYKHYCSDECRESARQMSTREANKSKTETAGYREQHDRVSRSLLTGDERNRVRRLLAVGESFTIKEAIATLRTRSEAKMRQWIQQIEAIGIIEATRVPFKAVLWSFTKHPEVERIRRQMDVPG